MSFSICGVGGANTGAIKCDRRRSIPKKIIIGGAEYQAADYASQSVFDAAFLADFKLAAGSSTKLFPFPEITGVTDKTEASKESTLGAFGPKVTLIEGRYAVEFDVIAGVTLEKQLRKFNGQQMPVFILDDSNALWGKIDSNGVFSGCDALIFTTPHKFGDGANGQTTKVSISFVSAADTYDSAAFVETGLSGSDMVGLLDAEVSKISNASNIYEMGIEIETAGAGVSLNVYDNFSTELANASLWKATVVATGVDHTITSVAANATTKGWTVTLDSTQYTALAAGAKVQIELVDPAALDAADVVGIESVATIVTK